MNKEYWKRWFEKLFSIPISLSVWTVFWLFYFRKMGWIGDVAFTTALSLTLGQRVYKDVKELKLNNKGGNNGQNIGSSQKKP